MILYKLCKKCGATNKLRNKRCFSCGHKRFAILELRIDDSSPRL